MPLLNPSKINIVATISQVYHHNDFGLLLKLYNAMREQSCIFVSGDKHAFYVFVYVSCNKYRCQLCNKFLTKKISKLSFKFCNTSWEQACGVWSKLTQPSARIKFLTRSTSYTKLCKILFKHDNSITGSALIKFYLCTFRKFKILLSSFYTN